MIVAMNAPTPHPTDRIWRNMELTMENIVRVQNCIAGCSDKNLRARLRLKNERRIQALESMRRSVNGQSRPLS